MDRVRSFRRLEWGLRIGVAIALGHAALQPAGNGLANILQGLHSQTFAAEPELEARPIWVPYSDEVQVCEDLIRELGGLSVEWVDTSVSRFCGVGGGRAELPQGLLFYLGKRADRDAQVGRLRPMHVTGVHIARPSGALTDLRKWRELTIRAIQKLKWIETIDIDCDLIGDDDIRQLKSLPNLVSLGSKRVSDTTLREISKLTRLQELNIGNGTRPDTVTTTDEGLLELGKLVELRHMNLGGATIERDIWTQFPELRELTLFGCDLSPDAYAGLVRCQKLTQFCLISDYDVPVALGTHLARLPHLTNVEIRAAITDRFLHALGKSKSISALVLSGYDRVTGDGLATLDHLPLKSISLTGRGMDGSILESIARFSQLEELRVPLTAVTDEQLDCLAQLKSLKSLYVDSRAPGGAWLIRADQFARLKQAHPGARISGSAFTPADLGMFQFRAVPAPAGPKD